MKQLYTCALVLCALIFITSEAVAQNTCTAPMVISSLPYTGTGLTTCGKANDYANFCSENNYMDGEDYVFAYTPSVSGCINVKLTGTSNYTGVFVFKGCPNASGTCSGKATSSTGNPSLNQISVIAGSTYYIIVDTWPTPNCTAFNISVTNCPAGSSCSSPKVIPSLPFQEANTTCGAGADYGSFNTAYSSCGPGVNDDGEDIVYTYTATKNQCINVSVTGWSYPGDGAFTISKACPTSATPGCIAVREGSGSTGPAAVNSIQVFAGTTLYITIDSDDFYATCQPFNIKIDTCATFIPQCSTSPPASDVCSSATPICDFTGYCGSTSASYTADAPSNINNVFCGSIENNGWVKFVAGATTASFNIFFGNCTNGDGIQALVLEATNCTNFVVKSNCYEPITASGNGVISATGLVVGNTYLIMIDGYAGDHCDYIIQANTGVLLPVDAGADVTLCPGQSTTLTAANGNNVYSWQPGGQTSKSITVTPAATTDYIVTSSSGNIGCPSPDSDTVRVTVVPTVTTTVVSVTNANSCSGTCDGAATINTTGGQTPYNTLWSHGPTSNTVGSLCPGTTYNVTVTDNVGCKSNASVTMPPPVIADVNFTAPPCGTSTVTLVPVASSGTGVFTYTGPGTLNIVNSGGGNYTASTSTFGSYDVTWTVTDGPCSRAVTKTINFREIPVANFSFPTPACGSKTVTLTTVATAGVGGFTFSGPGAITFINTGTNTYSATASSFGTYTISWIVNNNGCSATASKTITFTDQPVSSFIINPPACGSLTFSVNTSATAGSGAWSYTGPAGSVMNFTSSGANSYNVNASQYGSYTVTWTVTNSVCSATSSETFTLDKQPVANAGLDKNVCALAATLTAIPSIGNGLWTQISGPDIAIITDIHSASTPVSTPSFGSYVFRWTEVNGSCPASTDDVVVVFSQDPVGNAGPDQEICGFNTNLAGVAVIGTGVWSGSGIASTTNPNSAVSTAIAGNQTYTWTVSNGACTPVIDQVDVVYYKKPAPNAGPDQSVCGLNVLLNALPPTNAGSWIEPSAATFGSTSNPKSSAVVASYGTYTFVWEETNGNCPAARDTALITFVQTPTPNAGPDQSLCGLSTSFAAVNSSFTGSWSGPGNITNPGNRTSAITAPGYGTYSYVWSEFNAAPCPGKTDTVVLTFSQQTVANAGPDKNVCGTSTNLAAVRSVAGSAGLWTGDPGAIYGNATFPNTSVAVPAPGTYTFTWTEKNGSICPQSTDQVTITFVPPSNPNAGPDDAVCGVIATLAAVPSFGSGAWSYNGPGILTFSNINDPHATVNSNAFGLFNVAWTEGASPCIANTDTMDIQFSEPPVIEAGASPDKVCGLQYKMNATASVGTPKWSWLPSAGVTGNITFENGNDSIPTPKISASEYGLYDLVWSITNGPCRPPADTVALTFYKRPEPDAGPNISECDTLKAQLLGVTSVIGTWQWSSPSGGTINFTPDANRPDPVAEASVPGTYKLFFSETNDPVCGVVTDSLTVDFLVKPVSNAGTDGTACGLSYIMAGNLPSVGLGLWSVVGSTDPGFTATFDDVAQANSQVTLSATPPPTGVTLTFRWTVGNGNCPPVFDDVDITFKQVPNSVDAGADQVLCNTLSGNISANDFGGTGSWTIISAPSGSNPSLSSSTAASANVTSDQYGIYLIQRTVVVAGCPIGVVDVVNVDFRKLPVPDAGLDDTICGADYSLTGKIPAGRITGRWSQVSGPGTTIFEFDTAANSNISVPAGQFGQYTYRWLESNIGCPDVADDVNILFQEQPSAVSGKDFAVCGLVYDFEAVPSSANTSPTYIGEWIPVSGAGSMTLSPTNGRNPLSRVTVDNFGKYKLVWVESNGICESSADTINLQFVNPSNPNAGPDNDVCGLQDTLKAIPSFGLGEWIADSNNPGNVSFVNKADPASIVGVTNYGSYRFDWLEANSPCYANSDNVVINFHEQPTAAAGFDADTCGLIYKMNATPSVASAAYQGIWNGPIGSVFSNINDPYATVDVSGLGHGTYKFTWTEINGSACSASVDEVEITFIQPPVADRGNIPASVCGKSFNLNANPSVGVGQWSASGVSDFNFSSPTTPSTIGIGDQFGQYTIYWKEVNFGKNGKSCSSIDSAVVFLSPQPTAYAGKDSAICGNTITLNAVQSVSASVVSWTVAGNSADASFSPANNKSTTVTANKYGLLNFVFSEDIGNGACISRDTVSVNFVQQPIAEAGIPDSVCSLSTTLAAVPTVGNGSWSSLTTGVVFSPDLSNPSPGVSVPNYGIYKFVWKEDNGSPCKPSRDTVQVGFFKVPTPKAGLDFSICGTVANLNATPSTFGGKWTYSGTLNVVIATPNDPKSKVTLKPAGSADYSLIGLQWTETNVLCSANDQMGIYFSEAPNANAGADQILCGKDFTVNAIPSVGVGHWEHALSDTSLASFNNINKPTAYGTVNNFGIKVFTWIEQNPGVCPADTDQTQLSFVQAPTTYAGPDISVCSLSHTLTGKRSVGSGTWTKLNGPGIVTFGNNSKDTSLVTVSQAGTYNFIWTEFNAASCPIGRDTVKIYFEKAPVATAGPDINACSKSTNLQAVRSIGTGQWTYLGDPSATVSFGNANSPTTVFTSNKFGPHVLMWMENNTAVCGSRTDTTVVTFIEQPVADAGGPVFNICGNGLDLAAVPSAGIGQWSQVSGPAPGNFTSPFDSASHFTAASNGFGNYVLRWTENNGAPCAASSDDIQVNFYQQPNANGGQPSEVCGLDGNLSAIPSVGTGSWGLIPGPGQSVTFGDATKAATSVKANGYGDFQFVWMEKNGNVCPPDQDVVTITFKEAPTADAGPDQTICGYTTQLKSTNSTGTGIWILPAASTLTLADSSSNTSSVSNSIFGKGSIIWAESNGKVCPISYDTVMVDFAESPVAKAGPDDQVCGQTYKLGATPSVGTGLWTTTAPGAVFTPSASSATASVTIAGYGSYIFTWTETNKAPCLSSVDNTSIEFIKGPSGNISVSPASTCAGDSVKLFMSLSGTGPFNVSYSSNGSPATIVSGVDSGDFVTVNPQVTTTYVITQIEDGSGESCKSSSSTPVTVTVNPRPNGTIGGSYHICNGDSLTLPVSFSGTPPFSASFSNTDSKVFDGTGPYTYTYKPGTLTSLSMTSVSDAYCTGTPDASSVNVTINALPAVTISTPTTSTCEGSTVKLNLDLTAGKGPWTVYINNGQSTRTVNADKTPFEVTDIPVAGTTTYTVDSITDANGCYGTGNSVSVIVYANPDYTITSDTIICQNTSTDIKLNFAPTGSGPWTIDYNINGNNLSNSSMPNGGVITVSPASTTTYHFTRVTDQATGCLSDKNTNLTIVVVPNPVLSASVDKNEICRNDVATITLTYSGVEPFQVTLSNGVNYSGLRNGAKIGVSPLDDSTYTITAFKDGSGITCPSTVTMNLPIVVNQLPPVEFDVTKISSCAPMRPVFINNTDPAYIGANGTFWNFGDGSTSIEITPSHEYRNSGTYNISLKVVSDKGCVDSLVKSTNININPDPVANFHWTPEKPNLIENEVEFHNTTSGAKTYSWNFGNLATSTQVDPTYKFPNDDSATYIICLTAVSDSGCINLHCDNLYITGEMSVFVPTAFTPDGDGINDLFIPSVLGSEFNTYEFLVFDRWGEVIFKSNSPTAGWDGKVQGTQAKTDTYAWKLTFKDKYTVNRHEYFGKVTLIR